MVGNTPSSSADLKVPFALFLLGLLSGLPSCAGAMYFASMWWSGPPPQPRDLQSVVSAENALKFTQARSLEANTGPQTTTSTALTFGEIPAVNKLWRAISARVKVYTDTTDNDVATAVIGPLHADSWGDKITNPSPRENMVWPELNVAIFVAPSMVHKWVTVSADMDVTYPTRKAGDLFFTKNETLHSESRFFVVTPGELDALDHIKTANQSGGWAIMLGVIGLMSLWLCIPFLWERFSLRR